MHTSRSSLFPENSFGCHHSLPHILSLSFLLTSSIPRVLLPATPGRQSVVNRFPRGYGEVGGNQSGASTKIGLPLASGCRSSCPNKPGNLLPSVSATIQMVRRVLWVFSAYGQDGVPVHRMSHRLLVKFVSAEYGVIKPLLYN